MKVVLILCCLLIVNVVIVKPAPIITSEFHCEFPVGYYDSKTGDEYLYGHIICNHGYCNDKEEGPKCICDIGYTGPSCKEIDTQTIESTTKAELITDELSNIMVEPTTSITQENGFAIVESESSMTAEEQMTSTAATTSSDEDMAIDGKRIVPFDQKLSWHAAEEVCVSMGGHLPSIHTEEQNRQILEHFQDTYQWIGAHSYIVNKFEWTDQTEWDYDEVRVNHPDDNEECLCIPPYYSIDVQYQWYDGCSCDDKVNFVCLLPAVRYVVYDVLKTFEEAEKTCQEIGGHLPSIHNMEENKKILDQYHSNEKSQWWLGAKATATGYYSGFHYNFQWEDGTDWDFENLDQLKPDSEYGDEMCITTTAAARDETHQDDLTVWNNYPCDEQLPFICVVKQ